jgi:hypothetical protein
MPANGLTALGSSSRLASIELDAEAATCLILLEPKLMK